MPADLSLKKKDVNTVETGRPFSPVMFEVVLKKFTPDVPNKISGRPRFVFTHTFLCPLRSMFCLLLRVSVLSYFCFNWINFTVPKKERESSCINFSKLLL